MKHLIILLLLTPVLTFSQITEDLSINNTPVTKKLYTKGSFVFGPGFEKIKVGEKWDKDTPEDTEDVFISPGGGMGIEAALGYDFNSSLSSEIGIGYVFSGESVDETSFYFNKSTIRASIIYRLTSSRAYIPYFGAGLSTNLSVKNEAEEDGDKLEYLYSKPIGFNIFGGAEFKDLQSPLYGFVEMKLLILGDYEVEEAKFNGTSIPISIVGDDFLSMNANGLQFTLGVGYYLK